MKEYKEQFAITDDTIFALGEDIYTNNPLTPDLYVHELVHLRQQKEVGLTEWVYDFLHDEEARLRYEIEAYREQLMSIKDRNHRYRVLVDSARKLSSDLYGNIVSFKDAMDLLKIK